MLKTRLINLMSAGLLALLLSSCALLGKSDSGVNEQAKIIVGQSQGSFLWSLDGESWATFKPTESEKWNSLVYTNRRVVIAGMHGAISDSFDGVNNWRAVQTKDHRVWLYDLTYAKNSYIAVGMGGMIVGSSNLSLWQRQKVPTKSWLSSIASSGESLVVTGADGTLLYSTDANNWQARDSGTSEWLSSVNYLNRLFISVGAKGTILYSTDGAHWHKSPSNTKKWLYSSAYGNEQYLVGGENGIVLSSADGELWSIKSTNLPNNFTIKDMIYANKLFWLVGSHGVVASSVDGANWKIHDVGTTQNLYSIIYVPQHN